MKILKFIISYLKDWKNLLAHTIIGVLILLAAFYLPVPLYVRLGILVIVVLFNLYRMKREKTRKKTGIL